jgi:hypothetical protein
MEYLREYTNTLNKEKNIKVINGYYCTVFDFGDRKEIAVN